MNTTNLILKVKTLKEQGFSFNQIAEQLDISKSMAFRLYSEVNKSETDAKEEQIPVFQKTTKGLDTKAKKEVEMENSNPKLLFHLKKLEFQHEKQMKELEFEELERQREFQKEQLSSQAEFMQMKAEIEKLKLSQETKIDVPKTEIPDEIEEEAEIETVDETENISEITVPKKLQKAFETFAENIFKFQNEEIEEETAKELLDQNTALLKYFAKWIKAKEIEPNEVPQRLVLKKLQKILQSIIEDFENRGFFSSIYADFEIPEDLLDEISKLV